MKFNRLLVILVLIICILIAVYCSRNTMHTNGDEEPETKSGISIDLSCWSPDAETHKVIFPPILVNWIKTPTMSAEDVVDDFHEQNPENIYFDEMNANEDGSISIIMTNEQMSNWASKTETYIKERMNESTDRMYISINDNFTEITYYIFEGCEQTDYFVSSNMLCVYLMQAQMFEGVPSDEWKLKLTIINKETDEVFREVTFPYDEMSIPQAEWEAEFATGNE